MAEPGKLSAKQLELIAALATGATVADAAQRCQIPERTAYRWVKLPTMAAALEEARQSAFQQALNLLRSGVKLAIKTLADSMHAESETVRLRAAQVWLEQAINLHKMSEIEERFTELEALLRSSGLAR